MSYFQYFAVLLITPRLTYLRPPLVEALVRYIESAHQDAHPLVSLQRGVGLNQVDGAGQGLHISGEYKELVSRDSSYINIKNKDPVPRDSS